ncbi:Insulin-degrading enzyme, partial [Trachymyrmex zeteki]
FFMFRNQISESIAPVINMSTESVEKRYDDIIKSQNDDRLYRGLVLANKMKVLLISDPTTGKSAAAMDINVGSMCDPDDLPGLAHFCEHMLFLGSKKYPEQNDYDTYLSQNGGSSNASTLADHTTYYFDVIPEKLEGALNRFVQFFLAPLFKEDTTELELNAINSEHELHLTNDLKRFNRFEQSSASSSHPYSKFFTGNRETLDTIPKQKGINVRNKLLEFYEKYYSANIMSLCVLGEESLDELEDMIVNLFCEVRNKEIEVPSWPEHPFNDEHFRTIWYIVPIADTRGLDIFFPLPDMHQHYRSSPERYVSHLLEHEGKGSLLSALKAKEWSTSIVCGKRSPARGFSIFEIFINLTEEGIKHIEDIVLLVFQYINMLKLKGPIKWIYDEYTDIASTNFRFKEKSWPRDYVKFTVRALQEFPMNEILCAQCIDSDWRPDLIEEIMGYLKPENVRIHVVAKAYENIANETERWCGTKYKKVKVHKETMDMWNSAGFNDDLKLPPKNEFIATTFDIKPQTNVEKFPIILEDTSFIRLWYKKDDEFLVPRARMNFHFVCPFPRMDSLSCNLTYLFNQLLNDSLAEYTYGAVLAGLQWEFDSTYYGISLYIHGYDDKQRMLLEIIMDRMINFKVDPKRFEIIKEQLNIILDSYYRSKNLKNFAARKLCGQAGYYLGFLLSEQRIHFSELLETTTYLSVEGLQRFIPQLLSKMHVECLIYGNVTVMEARDIIKLIESKLTTGVPNRIPLLEQHLVLSRNTKLEDGCHFLFEAENNFNKSSCTLVYYPTGLQSTESNMLLQLLEKIIAQPCYNTLRANEQLGYRVFSDIFQTNTYSGEQGLEIFVQSDEHPQYVEKRINLFLDSMLNHISTMTEEQFEENKKTTLRFIKPRKLIAKLAMYWSEIMSQQYNFDRFNIEMAYLKTISRQQLLNFFKETVYSKDRRKLSIHVISTASTDEKVRKIDDILSFKKSQSLYPLPNRLKKFPHERRMFL